MRKTYALIGITLSSLFLHVQSICAAPIIIKEQQQVKKEIQQVVRQEIQNTVGSLAAVQSKIGTRVALLGVTLIAKGTDTLTVTGSDGRQYVVKVDALTQWRRRFWGKSNLDETNINDVLTIYGKWNNEDMTEVQARLIRNSSVQKRNGVFFGTVKTLSSNGWIMTTSKRGEQTVTIAGARLINRKEMGISQSDIAVGHRVRVKGLWDSKNNTISEVTQVKDFSLPTQPTPTPKP